MAQGMQYKGSRNGIHRGYWILLFCRLQEDGLDIVLINAKDVKNIAERKTDDCVVENCTLTTNDDSWHVGALVGAANVGEVTIVSCTDSDNTISMTWNASALTAPEDFVVGNVRHLHGHTFSVVQAS